MESYTVTHYKCEICGKDSTNMEEIRKCEASHYGLTIDEMQEYETLKEMCRYTGTSLSLFHDDESSKAFDDAVQKCVAFEKAHSIKKNFL